VTYLKKFPADSLKIDRMLWGNSSRETDRELVKLMITLAKSFNISTIVEGIENQSQLDFIRENGADMYQGYLFSKAVEESRFLSLLQETSVGEEAKK